MLKVMIRDNMSEIAREILESTGKIEVVVDNEKFTKYPEVLSEIIGEFDGLAVRSGTLVTKAVLKHAKRLKVIGRAGMGVDNIDLQYSTRQGIVVMNAPGGNTVSTAEHAISMMMSLARNIPQATSSLKSGRWEKKQLAGIEITGKTLGIIGLGQVGRIVADRALGLKMKVIASDPYVSSVAAAKSGARLVPLEELLERSDFISLHVPRLEETINMINKNTLLRMKQGARIINCSRGDVINLDDLYTALERGQIAGAALDVFPREPPDASLPILENPRVIASPHLGGSTCEAQDNVARMIAEQMASYLLDGIITNAVNFPSVSMEEMERLRPYLSLSEKMGSLMGQAIRSPHDISITYSGEITTLGTKPVTHAMVKGLLDEYTDTPINYVNAMAAAEEKGIKIKETFIREESGFSSLIKLKLEGTEKSPSEIWGTLYEGKHPRLIRIGEVYLDVIPEGSILLIQNIDTPGVIGNIGTTLGEGNVNIASFQLGRKKNQAMCLVNIDTPASDSVMDKIKHLPNILSVKQVHLS